MKKLVLSMILAAAVSGAMAGEKKEKAEAPAAAPANVVLSGTVIDHETSENLVGVKVELAGTNQVTYTDFDGNYSFENLRPGTYDVVASIVSYDKKCLSRIQVDASKNRVSISLDASN